VEIVFKNPSEFTNRNVLLVVFIFLPDEPFGTPFKVNSSLNFAPVLIEGLMH
jgi:hypothetical protein